MADVFVSYSRQDRSRVAPLVAAIEARGWSVWWDPRIAPGVEFDRLIDSELAGAAVVLVVWTPRSVTSRWVRGEAREAAERDALVPVRFDDAILPVDMRALHAIDFGDGTAMHAAVEEMLSALASHLGPPEGPAAAAAVAAAPAAGPPRLPICVLPFVNLGGDVEQDWFSDGITEDLITELSRWRLLAVRSRAASYRYRGVAVDIAGVARDLGVRFVVEGSVRRMGERVRISAQLIDAENGSHVWAEKFDRPAAELFAVQDDLVRTIVSTLVGRVQASDSVRARRKPPASLAAYECVLQGNALAWDDPAGAAEATRLFEQAIAIDPGYGMAHALLAAMRCDQWRHDPAGRDERLQEAFTLARRGVELDPGESTCHSLLAQVHHLRGEFDLCLEEVHRAVELNPANQWTMADMGMMLVYAGEPILALDWLRRAREVDPYFQASWYWRGCGMACLLLQRYNEAAEIFARMQAGDYRHTAFLAAALALQGDLGRARGAAGECLRLRPSFSIAHFMAKTPFRRAGDAAHLAEGMRKAGLPEAAP